MARSLRHSPQVLFSFSANVLDRSAVVVPQNGNHEFLPAIMWQSSVLSASYSVQCGRWRQTPPTSCSTIVTIKLLLLLRQWIALKPMKKLTRKPERESGSLTSPKDSRCGHYPVHVHIPWYNTIKFTLVSFKLTEF